MVLNTSFKRASPSSARRKMRAITSFAPAWTFLSWVPSRYRATTAAPPEIIICMSRLLASMAAASAISTIAFFCLRRIWPARHVGRRERRVQRRLYRGVEPARAGLGPCARDRRDAPQKRRLHSNRRRSLVRMLERAARNHSPDMVVVENPILCDCRVTEADRVNIRCRFRRIPARYSELMPAGIPRACARRRLSWIVLRATPNVLRARPPCADPSD
jgi:hypothetical protein